MRTSPAAAGTTSTARPAAVPSAADADTRPPIPLAPDWNGAVREARSSSRSIHGAAA